MNQYLKASTIIDWQSPPVLELAQQLAQQQRPKTLAGQGAIFLAKACFEWVRDQIYHSVDHQMNPVTWRASDVLQHRTGYCFAKSHLLAALLRANGIPAGFCYQRLSFDDQGAPYVLHGFNAVYLEPWGWYRIDPRGNREGINAQFTPPQEQLAYPATLPGEADFQTVLAAPLPIVIEALKANRQWDQALYNFPDLAPEAWESSGLTTTSNRKKNSAN